ncbi:MAG: phosphatase PAP2 family protein [Janthinobacterium lividum]
MSARERIAAADLALLLAVQRSIRTETAVTVATGLSHAGEHAAAWIGVGTLGAVFDPRRRRDWVVASTAVVAAHGASVVLKRVARRQRPMDPEVSVRVATPSRWSMPSSHATSTTAAALVFAPLLGLPTVPVVVGLGAAMAGSRLVLGVHYPSDVALGAVLGAATQAGVRRVAAQLSVRGTA